MQRVTVLEMKYNFKILHIKATKEESSVFSFVWRQKEQIRMLSQEIKVQLITWGNELFQRK